MGGRIVRLWKQADIERIRRRYKARSCAKGRNSWNHPAPPTRRGQLKHLNYRVKLLIFLLCALAILFIFNTAYSALNTLSRLDVVEA
jgi:hypothetical protein